MTNDPTALIDPLWNEYTAEKKRKIARNRKLISPYKKAQVRKRDGNKCRYCGTEEGRMTIDHLFPLSIGGTNSMNNLISCCFDCNQKKGSKLPGKFLKRKGA